MNRIGVRIKKKREQLNLQLNELAEKIGISPSALSQIEKAKSFPSIITLKTIAEKLHTTVGELIGENDSLANNPVGNLPALALLAQLNNFKKHKSIMEKLARSHQRLQEKPWD